jgi:predicted transcriptional regulator
LRHEKRHKLQIFYEILCAIQDDMLHNDNLAKPTHVQHYSRLSYDKMIIHFAELERKGMLQRHDNGLVSISDRGLIFLKQYDDLITFIDGVGLK